MGLKNHCSSGGGGQGGDAIPGLRCLAALPASPRRLRQRPRQRPGPLPPAPGSKLFPPPPRGVREPRAQR
ncbi:unnamed protein product, partial [Bubo scandiacus]